MKSHLLKFERLAIQHIDDGLEGVKVLTVVDDEQFLYIDCASLKNHDDAWQAFNRIVACVNACYGIEDPMQLINRVKDLNPEP